jgi:2-oxoglutarate dehydrogenase complex dehydrogenase (E1) component-like enzyme
MFILFYFYLFFVIHFIFLRSRITQPVTYEAISNHPTVFKIYSEQLIRAGILTHKDVAEQVASLNLINDKDFHEAKTYTPDPAEWLASNWQVSIRKAIVSIFVLI